MFEPKSKQSAPFLWIVDHASNHIPEAFNGLGLDPALLSEHIAWDIGVLALANSLQERLGGSVVAAPVSRLLIDMNRTLEHPGLIPEVSDAQIIPGNQNLTQAARQARIADYYQPYHARIAAAVQSLCAAGTKPFLVALHSFTPTLRGIARPEERSWHCGVLYNQDARGAHAALSYLKQRFLPENSATALVVGDNEPYSGKQLNATMDSHAEQAGHSYLSLEIRQDLLAHHQQIIGWAELLAPMFRAIVAQVSQNTP
jgi:predicted N-formylglutamate amidohydrolase